MKRQIFIIIMKTTEVIIEATDPTGANKAVVENPIEVPNTEEGASKAIIGDNTKATMGNITAPAVAITIIIITVIIEVEMDVAMVVIITEVTATVKAVIEAITFTSTTNITHMMMAHSPKHCFKGEHDINNLMEKMSLDSNNPHQSS